jgi:hypothetical protein
VHGRTRRLTEPPLDRPVDRELHLAQQSRERPVLIARLLVDPREEECARERQRRGGSQHTTRPPYVAERIGGADAVLPIRPVDARGVESTDGPPIGVRRHRLALRGIQHLDANGHAVSPPSPMMGSARNPVHAFLTVHKGRCGRGWPCRGRY